MNPLILVVEDDKSLQKYLVDLLNENGYSVRSTSKGAEAITTVDKIHPSLVILDLNLPDMTGESVCLQIRKKNPKLPIIMLTAKAGINEKVEGLSIGADDYITKPFEAKELLARIKARLRAQNEGSNSVASIEDLELDRRRIEVKRGGKVIRLTPHEFKLLDYLISNKGVVLTREMILNRVWSYSLDVESRVVDVYMGYLRKKIDGGFDKKLIHSVRGFGYTIKD
jgi:DNA-binding response OmpR family regulator